MGSVSHAASDCGAAVFGRMHGIRLPTECDDQYTRDHERHLRWRSRQFTDAVLLMLRLALSIARFGGRRRFRCGWR